MKIKLVLIDIETPRWLQRTLSIAAPLAAIVVTGAVLATPKQWANGDALTAAGLNSITVITNGTTKYSVGATHFCGDSNVATNGNFSFNGKTSYAAAKNMCELATACGTSPTAHMCDASEIVRSVQLGDSVTLTSWFSSMGWGTYSFLGNNILVDDCSAWTTAAATNAGPTYDAGIPSPQGQYQTCDKTAKIACCD